MKPSSFTVLLCSTVVTASSSILAQDQTNVTGIVHSRSVISDLVDEFVKLITSAVECTACNTFIETAKLSIALDDDLFVAVIAEVCKILKVQDDDVCEGAVRLEGPAIAAAMRGMSVPSKTSQLFCNTLAGLCPFPAVDAPPLSIPSLKAANVTRLKPSGQTPLKIVQYSDIHIDPQYATGSDANCTKPICCRNYADSNNASSSFTPAGANGDHKCDTPKSLEESMYAAIRQVAPDAKFTIFTGDIVDHAVWSTTQEQNTESITDAYGSMTGFGPIYGTIGNHEQNPANLFESNETGNNAQWVYDLIGSLWSSWITTTAITTTKDTGFYSSKVTSTNLRIISLNTNMYYKLNFALYQHEMESDPSGQLAWLVNELTAAETAGERVYIIGHMPMGESDSFHDSSHGFDQIANRFSNTIAAMFFGHTHKDEFEVSYSNYNNRTADNAVAMSYIMPSLTPTDGMPVFRIYDVDPVTFAVLDATTYIADMDAAAFQTTGPVWTKYYSAKETYGALVSPSPASNDELSPAFWHRVTEAFEVDDAAFAGYVAKKTRGWNVQACTGTCKSNTICQLRAGRSEDNCYVPSIGSISKRDVADADQHSHDGACGGSVFRDMFAAPRST